MCLKTNSKGALLSEADFKTSFRKLVFIHAEVDLLQDPMFSEALARLCARQYPCWELLAPRGYYALHFYCNRDEITD